MKLLVAAMMLFLLVPAVTAQNLPEILTGEDAVGDVMIQGLDGSKQPGAGQFGYLDITAARIEKASPTAMTFALNVVDPDTLWGPIFSQDGVRVNVELHFTFGGIHYFLDYGAANEACLRRYVSDLRSDPIHCYDATNNGELVATFDSSLITDLGGAALRHPAQLTDVHAETRQLLLGLGDAGSAYATDTGPDTGTWGGLRTPADPGAGPLLLTPRQSLRGSNGGGGVLLFEVVANNIGKQPLNVFLTTTGLPSSWSAQNPSRITLQADEERILPIIVTMPFGHQHGGTIRFNLTATVLDGQRLTQPLAVHFFDTPQPAGHHPGLYLHSVTVPGNGIAAWMNTIINEDGDQAVPAPSFATHINQANLGSTKLYFTPLSEALAIGLDFDITKLVTASFGFEAQLPETVHVSARLEHCNPTNLDGRDYAEYGGDLMCRGTWIPLAGLDQQVELVMGHNQLDWNLDVTPYADLVPPQPEAMMAFNVEVARSQAAGGDIDLTIAGSKLALPLYEYQPALSTDLAHLGDLAFTALPEHRQAPKGSTVQLHATLANRGNTDQDVVFEAAGLNSQWLRLPNSVTIPAGQVFEFALTIAIPRDAKDNLQAYLVARTTGANELVAAAPLAITLTDGPPIHEVTGATKGTQAPGLGTLTMVAVLALATLRRRN